MARGFSRSAFSRGFQRLANAAGSFGNKAKALTRQKHKAHLLAKKYNEARELQAAALLIPTVSKFHSASETLPKAKDIDFAAMAKDTLAAQEFLSVIEQIQEEEEIFQFIMAVA